jgi:hypothetical protein
MARTVKNTKQQWQKEGECNAQRNDWEVMTDFSKSLVEKVWLNEKVCSQPFKIDFDRGESWM